MRGFGSGERDRARLFSLGFRIGYCLEETLGLSDGASLVRGEKVCRVGSNL